MQCLHASPRASPMLFALQHSPCSQDPWQSVARRWHSPVCSLESCSPQLINYSTHRLLQLPLAVSAALLKGYTGARTHLCR